jgi:hypothetical protein
VLKKKKFYVIDTSPRSALSPQDPSVSTGKYDPELVSGNKQYQGAYGCKVKNTRTIGCLAVLLTCLSDLD